MIYFPLFVKGLIIYMTKRLHQRILLLLEQRAILSGQDRPILPAQVANQNTGFTSSCPLTEAGIIIIISYSGNTPHLWGFNSDFCFLWEWAGGGVELIFKKGGKLSFVVHIALLLPCLR